MIWNQLSLALLWNLHTCIQFVFISIDCIDTCMLVYWMCISLSIYILCICTDRMYARRSMNECYACMLCYVVFCCVTLCYVKFCYALPCYATMLRATGRLDASA